ncbi:MAG: hypothetical protein J0J04_08010 [Microbacterium sp.]|uniref:hypothetical protein n=1 Tax=Microbacterium sp. TaxID=51671 RepID=UPI001AD5B596|nr:hypothetical protein [Microbacterium sp.]MBN9214744.1 hypothetical protein [Microbacterium sp.]
MTAIDDLARAAAERRYPPQMDTVQRARVPAALRDAYIEGFLAAASELAAPFGPGDRVFYSGPVVNPDWDRTREGSVLAVHQTIDVQWDHGVTNYAQPASEFTAAGADRSAEEQQA